MRRNGKGSLMRPDGLPESSSWPVVTPLSPSVVYASETPDALDDQYEGRAQGFTALPASQQPSLGQAPQQARSGMMSLDR